MAVPGAATGSGSPPAAGNGLRPSTRAAYSTIRRHVLANRIAVSFALIAFIAFFDWLIAQNIAMGLLYVFPMLLAGGSLKRWQVLLMAAGCALLRVFVEPFDSNVDMLPRLANSALAFGAAGLYAQQVGVNRRQAQTHLKAITEETRLRREAEEELRVLIETTPLGILIAKWDGNVLQCNRAAREMFGLAENFGAHNVAEFLPSLSKIPVPGAREQMRWSLDEHARRANGELFLAHVWFSRYRPGKITRLAVIVADTSDEVRDREELDLQQLLDNSRLLVGAAMHEVRNLAVAISLVARSLAENRALADNPDVTALSTLVDGVRNIASRQLDLAAGQQRSARVELQDVLNELRIIVEPGFREAGVTSSWTLPDGTPPVAASHHPVLQICLNLVSNALRALEAADEKRFVATARWDDMMVYLELCDSGAGVSFPDRLFSAFHEGSEQSGLGLYISRVMIRQFGGDLRYHRKDGLTCFTIELPVWRAHAGHKGSK